MAGVGLGGVDEEEPTAMGDRRLNPPQFNLIPPD
jgi:hypothetical protein